MNIQYTLHKITRNSSFGLSLTLKSLQGAVHGGDRAQLSPKDRAIVDFLIKDFNVHKNLKTAPLEHSFLEKVPISDVKMGALLTELAKTGQVLFESKKIVIDPLSSVKLFYEVALTDQEAVLKAFCVDGKGRFPVGEIEAYWGNFECWILHRGLLKKLKHDVKWLLLGMSSEVLSGKKKEHFLDHYENGLPLDGSIPEAVFNQIKMGVIAPKPQIRLNSDRGLFFHLYFEYPSKGTYPFLDKANPFLNREDELFWEEVLLESGVTKKGPEYFISAPEQEKCFRKLIEAGFTLYHKSSQKIVLLDHIQGDIIEKGDMATLNMKLTFGDLTIGTGEAFLASLSKTGFTPLDANHVGLLPISILNELDVVFKGVKKGDAYALSAKKRGDLSSKILNIQEPVAFDLNALCFTHFNLTLLPFQKIGVAWLLTHFKKDEPVLLADDMGLGKTVQVLALIDLLKTQLPYGVLVVCPKSIKAQWKKAAGEMLAGYHGVIEVKTFHELRQNLEIQPYSLLILDEAQGIKNAKTQLFEKMCQVKAGYRIALTGTPIENSLSDLISIFNFLNPSLVEEFQGTACALMHEKIKRRLSPYILRREKQEVLADLPPLFEQSCDIEMSVEQQTAYFKLLEEAKKNPGHVFSLITKLRMAALDARLVDQTLTEMSSKTSQIIDDIQEIVESGQKVLLFSQFTSYLALIKAHLEELKMPYAYLDGQTGDREKQIEDFKGQKSVFLISLKAGGVGLNLQEADYVLIADPWWNEAVEKQAIDRAYRLGRKGSVIAKRYLSLNTLEKKLEELKQAKWALLDSLECGTSQDTEGLYELLFS